MSEPKVSVGSAEIRCPSCGVSIPLSDALSGRIEEGVEARVRERLEAERTALGRKFSLDVVSAVKTAEERVRAESEGANRSILEELGERRRRSEDVERRELETLRLVRDVEDRERALELRVERAMAQERERVWGEATQRADESHRLKEVEYQRKMGDLTTQVSDLKRRLEQGSQQEQGEVQEVVLEADLRMLFPHDLVSEIGKGIRGGDCVQEVFTPSGVSCGTILWESKRTKAWGGASWTDKAKADMRAAKADIAVIITQSLPPGVSHVGLVDGVWVSDFPSRLGIATALRYGLVQVARSKTAMSGQSEKMSMAYEYLSGPSFRQGVQAAMESFAGLRADLDAERRAIEKHWARREKRMEAGVRAIAQLYGSVEGILGGALPPMQVLEMPDDLQAIPEKT